MQLDIQKLDEYIQACIDQKVQYGLGAKDPVLGTFPPDFTAIDCSGFIRALIFYASSGAIKLPDGSWNQMDWLRRGGFSVVHNSDAGLMDGQVRACVYEEPGKTGHIWLVLNGKTYESHGHAGPSHRAWDDPILERLSEKTTTFILS